jgi:hypothetical protein
LINAYPVAGQEQNSQRNDCQGNSDSSDNHSLDHDSAGGNAKQPDKQGLIIRTVLFRRAGKPGSTAGMPAATTVASGILTDVEGMDSGHDPDLGCAGLLQRAGRIAPGSVSTNTPMI